MPSPVLGSEAQQVAPCVLPSAHVAAEPLAAARVLLWQLLDLVLVAGGLLGA